VSAQAAVDN